LGRTHANPKAENSHLFWYAVKKTSGVGKKNNRGKDHSWEIRKEELNSRNLKRVRNKMRGVSEMCKLGNAGKKR